MSDEQIVAELKKAFQQLDTDHSGKLSKAEFRKFPEILGESIPAEVLDALLEAIDKEVGNGDGELDFEEFVTLIMALAIMGEQ